MPAPSAADLQAQIDEIQSKLDGLGELAAAVAGLTRVLAQPTAQAEESPAPAPKPIRAIASELTPLSAENEAHRAYLGGMLEGVLSSHQYEIVIDLGARGLYRRFRTYEADNDPFEGMSRQLRIACVEDAQRENVKDAIDMGRDLLKFWDQNDPPDVTQVVVTPYQNHT